MTEAAISANGRTLPIASFSDSACFSWFAYQISSKSNDKRPIYSVSLILQMAAAAISENDHTLPVL
jgi:hypothetical protein